MNKLIKKDLFGNELPTKCKLCNKDRGVHKATTLNCPLPNQGNRTHKIFYNDQFYEPKGKKNEIS